MSKNYNSIVAYFMRFVKFYAGSGRVYRMFLEIAGSEVIYSGDSR